MMTRREMLEHIHALDAIPDGLKAAASLAIPLMPKKEFDKFATIADRGIALLQSGDDDGLRLLFRELGADEDVTQALEAFLAARPGNPDQV